MTDTTTTAAARAASLANMKKQIAAAGQEPTPDRPGATLTGAALAKASMLRELRAQGSRQ